MIYDVYMEYSSKSSRSFNRVPFPVAAPLPLTPFYRDNSDTIIDINDIYENWVFIHPYYIFSRSQCKVWKISIELQHIIKDIVQPLQLIHFLRRYPNLMFCF